VIGATGESVREPFLKSLAAVGCIGHIHTGGNSCYAEKFRETGVAHLHGIGRGKSRTHLVESTNSSIRDNLARFNRRSKRYSKKLDMLDSTLLLYFHRKQFRITIK